MVPNSEQAPILDESDSLYRETLLFMRIELKSDKRFFEVVKVLNTVFQNIMKYPYEEKYCKLRLSNPNIRKNVTDNEQSKFLLELIGFESIPLIPDSKPG